MSFPVPKDEFGLLVNPDRRMSKTKLAKILRKLPRGSQLVINDLGTLAVCDKNMCYLGWIDMRHGTLTKVGNWEKP